MASGPFTVAQLARAVGVSIDDVRFYLESGLLQPPRRRRGRSGDRSFHAEHVERLRFIENALKCGFTHEDIASFIDPAALVTCGDVYAVTTRRLEALRKSGRADTPTANCLERLIQSCSRAGPGKTCEILQTLSAQGVDQIRPDTAARASR